MQFGCMFKFRKSLQMSGYKLLITIVEKNMLILYNLFGFRELIHELDALL